MERNLAFKARSELKTAIRNFFQSSNYMEVDTPFLVPSPGTEVHLDYFSSHWIDFQNKSHKRFLRSSPELHLKQAMTCGLQRVFQIAPCFRNGGEAAKWHHPEFTMLEWYEAGISYHEFMDQTVALIHACRQQLHKAGFSCITIPEQFEKISVGEAFSQFVGIDLIDQDPDLAAKAIAKGKVSIQKDDDFETCFFKLLLDEVEPELCKRDAVILYDYPASQSALAKVEEGKAKRFELYINGIELSNAFLELLDPVENAVRIRESQNRRKALGKEEIGDDPYFLEAMNKGLPECCGNALGFDRLLALLLGLDGIKDVIPFHENQIFPL